MNSAVIMSTTADLEHAPVMGTNYILKTVYIQHCSSRVKQHFGLVFRLKVLDFHFSEYRF